MLGVFCKTFTSNDKYPLRDCVNLLSPIEMQLSLKAIIFSDFFVPFLESKLKFKHFENKDDCDAYFVSEITECERLGQISLKKAPFQNTL